APRGRAEAGNAASAARTPGGAGRSWSSGLRGGFGAAKPLKKHPRGHPPGPRGLRKPSRLLSPRPATRSGQERLDTSRANAMPSALLSGKYPRARGEDIGERLTRAGLPDTPFPAVRRALLAWG